MALAQFEPVSPREEVDLEAAKRLNDIFHFTNVGLAIVFIFSLVTLIGSGIYFITAGGDEGVLDEAHGLWRVAAFGTVTALIGYVIVNLIKFFI